MTVGTSPLSRFRVCGGRRGSSPEKHLQGLRCAGCASSRSGRFRRATSFCPRSPLRRCYSRRSRTSAATNVLRAQKSSADAPRVSSPGSRARALPRPRAAAGFCRCSCLPCMLSGAAGSCAAQPRCEVAVKRPPVCLPPCAKGVGVCECLRTRVLARFLTLCLVSLSSTPVVTLVAECVWCTREVLLACMSTTPPC